MRALFRPRASGDPRVEDDAEPKAGTNDIHIGVRSAGTRGADLDGDSPEAWAQQTVGAQRVVGQELVVELVTPALAGSSSASASSRERSAARACAVARYGRPGGTPAA